MTDCAIENVLTYEFQLKEGPMIRAFVCGDCDATLENQRIPRHRRIGGGQP